MKRCRLIYRSTAVPEVLKPESLASLGKKASAKNARLGISGLLLLSNNRFLQVLEGPVAFVNELYGRIVNDPRHREVTLVSYETISGLCFPDWSMRVLNLDELPSHEIEALREKYSAPGPGIPIPEDAMQVHGLLLDARQYCVAVNG